MSTRKPLTEWVAVPRWVAETILGTACTQQNLAIWKVDGPVVAWPEDVVPKFSEPLPPLDPPPGVQTA